MMDKKKIKELEEKISNKIHEEGMYHKFSGSWDIIIEYDEELSEESIEEKEPNENMKLFFKMTETMSDEDGGKTHWNTIRVEVDEEFKILEIEDY